MRTDLPETYVPTDSLARGTREAVGEFLVYRDLRTVDDTALYEGTTSRFHTYSLLDSTRRVDPHPAWRYKSEPDVLCFPPASAMAKARHQPVDAVALIPLRDEQLRFRLSPNGFEVNWPAGFAWYLVPTRVLEEHPEGRGTSVQRIRLAELASFQVFDEDPLTRARLLSILTEGGTSEIPSPATRRELATSPRSL